MTHARVLEIATADGRRERVALRTYLDPERVERAAEAANQWIKALRRVEVNDRPLRDRFTYRGDSLWWFTELYLHKQGVILDAWETALALEALAERERPTHVRALAPGSPEFAAVGAGASTSTSASSSPGPSSMSGAATAGAASVSVTVSPGASSASGTASTDASSMSGAASAGASSMSGATSAGAMAGVAATTTAVPTSAGLSRSAAATAGPDLVLQHLLPQAAARYGFTFEIEGPPASAADRWRTEVRSFAYTWTALASRLQPRRLLAPPLWPRRGGSRAGGTLVFAHSAFWRRAPGSADEGEEGYIGAVLRELRARADVGRVRLIGVGPRTNFRARRWWHPLKPRLLDAQDPPLTPIEDLASWRTLAGSRHMWRDRLAIERALLASAALREAAHIETYDVWPILAGELRGVARLQFPWSARAMDEAAAALDACRPRVVVTYAEAGGWGRALILEARRRGIPSVGLQHGFIYRHWLNYLHAADEMAPSPGNRQDCGFPRPDLTLLYDDHAAHHLLTHGRFPERSLRVTGSPALDALAASVAHVTDADRARVRNQLDAAPGDRLVLVVSKFTQIAEALPALAAAVAQVETARLVIKPHPAETADAYAAAIGGAPRVTIAPPSLDLASLLASARLLVTVNSTVAIDTLTLGIPALVVLLPNNLTPFVEAGAMAGAHADADGSLRQTLADLVLHDGCRDALVARGRAFAAAHDIRADGQAAARAAAAIAELMERRAAPRVSGDSA